MFNRVHKNRPLANTEYYLYGYEQETYTVAVETLILLVIHTIYRGFSFLPLYLIL